MIFRIPRPIISYLTKFKNSDIPYCRINGLIVHDDLLEDTPCSWKADRSSEAYICEFMHLLLAAHLGQPFSWETQQGGRMVNDVLPVREAEHEQLGISSKSHLMWHVEDAFHEARGDFLSLMCLRNHENLPTLISSPDLACLSDKVRDILFTEQYSVRADDAHNQGKNLMSENGDEVDDEKLSAAFAAASSLRQISILFGHLDRPYLRLDTDTLGREEFPTEEAKSAYNELCVLVDSSATEEHCGPGDILFINNFLAVHGRAPFEARYDGSDRWLQRFLLNSDFRKMAKYREDPTVNVLVGW